MQLLVGGCMQTLLLRESLHCLAHWRGMSDFHKSAAIIFIAVSLGFHNYWELIGLLCLLCYCFLVSAVVWEEDWGQVRALLLGCRLWAVSQWQRENPDIQSLLYPEFQVCAANGNDLLCFWVYSPWTCDISIKVIISEIPIQRKSVCNFTSFVGIVVSLH